MDTPVLVARQLLLFLHLIAFAIAFAEIVREDLSLLVSRRLDPEALGRVARLIPALLAVLWATGLAMVWMDLGADLAAVLDRPKLLTKIAVVGALTLNGLLLHRLAFPMMVSPQRAPGRSAAICAALGALSSVSWTYASFVGVARLIAPKLTLELFLGLYALALAFGLLVALAVVRPRLQLLMTADDRAEAPGLAAAAA